MAWGWQMFSLAQRISSSKKSQKHICWEILGPIPWLNQRRNLAQMRKLRQYPMWVSCFHVNASGAYMFFLNYYYWSNNLSNYYWNIVAPEKTSTSDYAKGFDCVDHNKLWKILKEMGIPDHLACLLRSLHAAQEATVRTRPGTMDWFKIGKGVHQGCILSPCLFNLYAEYIMWNAGLDESQAGIKITGKNINSLIYAEGICTLRAESKEELKSLLMRVKEESE